MGPIHRIAVLLLLLAGALPGQRYSFKEYGQDQGLTNLDVYCLLEDRTGFLWVGTADGLFRYDGRQFRAYTKAQGLPSTQIEALHQTSDGDIWVGTTHGLARLKGDAFETVRSGPANVTHAISSDALGNLYVGTNQGLLVAPPAGLRGKREFRLYTIAGRSILQQPVYGIGVESPLRVWYGCGLGICLLENGSAQPVAGPDVPPESWRGFLFDRQGTLWVRSYTSLIALAKGAAKFVRRDDGLPASGRIPAVLTDRDGELYVPTAQGLARRTATGWTLLRKANGLPTSAVDFFLQDREGSAWIALDGGGLVRWLGYKTAETWTETEGLSHDVVWSLWRDERSSLWAATQAGVSRFLPERGHWQAWRHPGLGAGEMLATAPGPNGTWWIGKAPGGVFHLDPRTGKGQLYGAASGLANDWVYNLATDAAGQPWVGTGSGPLPGNPRRPHMALRARPDSRTEHQDRSRHPGGQPRHGLDQQFGWRQPVGEWPLAPVQDRRRFARGQRHLPDRGAGPCRVGGLPRPRRHQPPRVRRRPPVRPPFRSQGRLARGANLFSPFRPPRLAVGGQRYGR